MVSDDLTHSPMAVNNSNCAAKDGSFPKNALFSLAKC